MYLFKLIPLLNIIIIQDKEMDHVHFSKLFNQPGLQVTTCTMNELAGMLEQSGRQRIIVKKGQEYVLLHLSGIVLFYTENKLVYAVDQTGKKFLVDKNLGDLEQELDKKYFFRANRQYIINLNFIKSFRAYEKVKLSVEVENENMKQQVIISQETAPMFRRWMYSS